MAFNGEEVLTLIDRKKKSQKVTDSKSSPVL